MGVGVLHLYHRQLQPYEHVVYSDQRYRVEGVYEKPLQPFDDQPVVQKAHAQIPLYFIAEEPPIDLPVDVEFRRVCERLSL